MPWRRWIEITAPIIVHRTSWSTIRLTYYKFQRSPVLPVYYFFDIREYYDKPEYQGATRKGVRIPIECLPTIVAALEELVKRRPAETLPDQPPTSTPSRRKKGARPPVRVVLDP